MFAASSDGSMSWTSFFPLTPDSASSDDATEFRVLRAARDARIRAQLRSAGWPCVRVLRRLGASKFNPRFVCSLSSPAARSRVCASCRCFGKGQGWSTCPHAAQRCLLCVTWLLTALFAHWMIQVNSADDGARRCDLPGRRFHLCRQQPRSQRRHRRRWEAYPIGPSGCPAMRVAAWSEISFTPTRFLLANLAQSCCGRRGGRSRCDSAGARCIRSSFSVNTMPASLLFIPSALPSHPILN